MAAGGGSSLVDVAVAHNPVLDHRGAPAGAEEEHGGDQTEHAGRDQDPTDHLDVDAAHRGVDGEGEDGAYGHQKDADADAHVVIPFRWWPPDAASSFAYPQ